MQKEKVLYLVSKAHDAVVGFAAHTASDTLRGVPHRVERKEIVFPHMELLPQVLQPSLGSNQKCET